MSDNFGLDVTVSTDQTLSNDESLETSASELMDELFAQLDHKIREGETSPTPTSSSLTRVRSRRALSVLEESSDLEVSYTPLETGLAPRYAPDWQLSLDETVGIGNPQDSTFNQRLFFCIALTSIGAALVWVGTQLTPRTITVPAVAEVTTPATSSLPINPSDVQFAASMTQSLQKIDSKKSAPPAAATPATAQPAVAAVPVTTPPVPQPQGQTLSKPALPKVSSVQAVAPKLPAKIPANVTPARIPAKQEPVPVQSAPQVATTEATELPQVQPEAQPNQSNVIDEPQTIAVAKPDR